MVLSTLTSRPIDAKTLAVPAAISRAGPIRATRRGVRRDMVKTPSGTGRKATPDWMGL